MTEQQVPYVTTNRKGKAVIVKPKKLRKNLEKTTRSQIRSACRQLFLRSREHSFALKRDNRACQKCGAKQTKTGKDKTKWILVEAHHKQGIENWQKIFEVIYEYLLCSPDKLECLCKSCHKKEGEK